MMTMDIPYIPTGGEIFKKNMGYVLSGGSPDMATGAYDVTGAVGETGAVEVTRALDVTGAMAPLLRTVDVAPMTLPPEETLPEMTPELEGLIEEAQKEYDEYLILSTIIADAQRKLKRQKMLLEVFKSLTAP